MSAASSLRRRLARVAARKADRARAEADAAWAASVRHYEAVLTMAERQTRDALAANGSKR